MKVVLGADHRGFTLKQEIKHYLLEHTYQVHDVGDLTPNTPDDYPDFALAAAKEVIEHTENIGIVICGSGVGVSIAANKVIGVRCGFGINPEQVQAAREDDDINMLALASDYISKTEAIAMIEVLLTTKFAPNENHTRRLQKIAAIEKNSNESTS